MDKRLLAAVAIGFLLLSLGCTTEEKLTAEQVRDRAVEAMENVETYSFSTDISMLMVGGEMDMGVSEAEISMDGNGKVDMKNKKMFMDMSMSMMGMSMDMEQYIIDDIQYMKMPFFGWVKNKTSADTWEQQDYAGLSGELMYTQVELLSDEKLDGENCYVLKVDVDLEKMMDVLGKQMGSTSMVSAEDLGSIKEAEIREWVSKDTFLVKKLFMYMNMEEEGSTLDMNMTMTFSDYNKPVDIVLPSEAENAVDMESMMVPVA
ncbi:MAG: hypothetical protein JW778_08050 [Candidatus Altiarchaeota archaeon]|nr:hypothetical protein [Candidatus Altiarchaeota archaeon]